MESQTTKLEELGDKVVHMEAAIQQLTTDLARLLHAFAPYLGATPSKQPPFTTETAAPGASVGDLPRGGRATSQGPASAPAIASGDSHPRPSPGDGQEVLNDEDEPDAGDEDEDDAHGLQESDLAQGLLQLAQRVANQQRLDEEQEKWFSATVLDQKRRQEQLQLLSPSAKQLAGPSLARLPSDSAINQLATALGIQRRDVVNLLEAARRQRMAAPQPPPPPRSAGPARALNFDDAHPTVDIRAALKLPSSIYGAQVDAIGYAVDRLSREDAFLPNHLHFPSSQVSAVKSLHKAELAHLHHTHRAFQAVFLALDQYLHDLEARVRPDVALAKFAALLTEFAGYGMAKAIQRANLVSIGDKHGHKVAADLAALYAGHETGMSEEEKRIVREAVAEKDKEEAAKRSIEFTQAAVAAVRSPNPSKGGAQADGGKGRAGRRPAKKAPITKDKDNKEKAVAGNDAGAADA